MKKAITLAVMAAIFVSCNKQPINETLGVNQSKTADLIKDIHAISEKTLKSDRSAQVALRIKNPGTVALADAVGGAIAGGTASWTGIGAVFAPYATVWGAFWFSKSVAEVGRVATDFSSPNNPSVPAGLEYAYIGETHNNLVFTAYQNGEFPVLINGHLHPSTSNRLKSYSYSGFPVVSSDPLSNFYDNNVGIMEGYVAQANPIANEGIQKEKDIIRTSSLSEDAKAVIIAIIDDVAGFNGSDLKALTDYCLQTEGRVNNSQLTNSDKAIVKQFLAIAHASYYFWSAN